ncbi:MAG: hypothetical protein ABIJ21_09485 [Nanoarchaeota archaeon]
MNKIWLLLVVLVAISSVFAENTCTDTDGGDDIFTAGSVSGLFDDVPYEHFDVCAVSADYLNEWSCRQTDTGMVALATTFPCEFGCENGACWEYEIPEFGLVAASIALAGAVAGFFFLRKR